jgi:Phosphoesterase family
MTGTLDPEGKSGGPVTDNSIKPYRWETYPERLERAGISWRIYHDLDDYGCNVCRFFAQYHDLPQTSPLFDGALRNRPLYELLWDLKTSNIPSHLDRPQLDGHGTSRFPAGGRRGQHQSDIASAVVEPEALGENRGDPELRRE